METCFCIEKCQESFIPIELLNKLSLDLDQAELLDSFCGDAVELLFSKVGQYIDSTEFFLQCYLDVRQARKLSNNNLSTTKFA